VGFSLDPRLALQAVGPVNPLGHVGYFSALLPEVDKGDKENPVTYPCLMIESLVEGDD